MDGLDPRHGSHAGAIQHYKDGEPACAACLIAANGANERRRYLKHIGQAATVELGDRAWRIIDTGPLNRIAHATGITHHRLRDYINAGPQYVVRRTTRDRILAADNGWTVTGLQRRLQGLTMLGWSMRQLADRSSVAVDSLKRLRASEDRQFVKHNVAVAVLALYDDLHMTPAPDGRSRIKTLADARSRGWVAPLAWGARDIDDPTAKPHRGGRDHAIDEVVVQRLLAGQRTDSTSAEKDEAMRRWVAAGGSRRQLALIHGWNDGRYGKDQEAAS